MGMGMCVHTADSPIDPRSHPDLPPWLSQGTRPPFVPHPANPGARKRDKLEPSPGRPGRKRIFLRRGEARESELGGWGAAGFHYRLIPPGCGFCEISGEKNGRFGEEQRGLDPVSTPPTGTGPIADANWSQLWHGDVGRTGTRPRQRFGNGDGGNGCLPNVHLEIPEPFLPLLLPREGVITPFLLLNTLPGSAASHLGALGVKPTPNPGPLPPVSPPGAAHCCPLPSRGRMGAGTWGTVSHTPPHLPKGSRRHPPAQQDLSAGRGLGQCPPTTPRQLWDCPGQGVPAHPGEELCQGWGGHGEQVHPSIPRAGLPCNPNLSSTTTG